MLAQRPSQANSCKGHWKWVDTVSNPVELAFLAIMFLYNEGEDR